MKPGDAIKEITVTCEPSILFTSTSKSYRPCSSVHGTITPSPMSSGDTVSMDDHSYGPRSLSAVNEGVPTVRDGLPAHALGMASVTTTSDTDSLDSSDGIADDGKQEENRGPNFHRINWRVVGGGVKIGAQRDGDDLSEPYVSHSHEHELTSHFV